MIYIYLERIMFSILNIKLSHHTHITSDIFAIYPLCENYKWITLTIDYIKYIYFSFEHFQMQIHSYMKNIPIYHICMYIASPFKCQEINANLPFRFWMIGVAMIREWRWVMLMMIADLVKRVKIKRIDRIENKLISNITCKLQFTSIQSNSI